MAKKIYKRKKVALLWSVIPCLLFFSCLAAQAYAPRINQLPFFGEALAQEARDETLRAALAGWKQEQFNVATFYDEGGALGLDYEMAAFWYDQAARQQHSQALLRLGQLYYFGLVETKDSKPDYAHACKLFEQAAANHDGDEQGEAMFYLGSCALVRQDLPDFERAQQWYKQAIEHGYRPAAFHLATIFTQGEQADFAQAAHWYEQAALWGERQAFLPLARLYYQGQGRPQDFSVAYQWFEKAAHRGMGEAAFYLGWMLEKGEGVSENLPQARHWYTLAAKKGEAAAAYNLALLYEEGRGEDRDFSQALHFYQQAATLGDVDALVKIGSFYQQGLGVVANIDKAFAYYRQAAAMGDEEMQYYLGLSYGHLGDGDAPQRDWAQAKFWLEKAAHQGHSLAQAKLDMLRRLGIGER